MDAANDTSPASSAPDSPEFLRLNRFLAQAGLGARRKCDDLIRTGNIYVNGAQVAELGVKIRPGIDKVEYHGKEVRPIHALEYLAYHKPRDVVVTRTDPQGRTTIYTDLSSRGRDITHLNYVGRLDMGSEGLLLLTNDGDLIHAITHPRFQIKKVYQVRIDRVLAGIDIRRMLVGVASEDQILHAGEVRELGEIGSEFEHWYEIDLYEGKNRQIRRMFEALGYQVGRLRRVQFGSVKLHELARGEIRPLTEREVGGLKNSGHKPDSAEHRKK